MFKQEKYTLSSNKEVVSPKNKNQLIITITILCIALAMYITEFDVFQIINNANEFTSMIGDMFPPNWNYFHVIKEPILDTIKMSIIGSLIGVLVSFPIAFFAANNINHNRIILIVVRFCLSIIRTLPMLVYALIFTYIFDFGTFAGTMAITVFTIGVSSKMIYEFIETIDLGAFEAAQSTGASKPRAFRFAVVPQILPTYLSIGLYSLEINIRGAAILGYVGAGGIGLLINRTTAYRQYAELGMILISIFIVVVIIESISRYIRKVLV